MPGPESTDETDPIAPTGGTDPTSTDPRNALIEGIGAAGLSTSPNDDDDEEVEAEFDIQADDKALANAIAEYNKRFKIQPNSDGTMGYTKHHSEPVTQQDGRVTFEFENEKEAVGFFAELATEKGQKFSLYDDQKNLIAFSNGDRNLYRGPKPAPGEEPDPSTIINPNASSFGDEQQQQPQSRGPG